MTAMNHRCEVLLDQREGTIRCGCCLDEIPTLSARPGTGTPEHRLANMVRFAMEHRCPEGTDHARGDPRNADAQAVDGDGKVIRGRPVGGNEPEPVSHGRLEDVEDRLWSALNGAGMRHSDRHVRLLKSVFGQPGVCSEACLACAIRPPITRALRQAVNAKLREIAALLERKASELTARDGVPMAWKRAFLEDLALEILGFEEPVGEGE